jgi:hypothetical protein
MPAQKLHLLNGFLLMATTLMLCSFQTTFWFQVVGGVAGPMMWLLVFLYIALYRKRTEAIFINYGLALIISPFTSMGLGTLWTITLIYTLVVSFVKERVFWPGTRYFIAASALSTVALQLISWLLSRVLESNPIGAQVGPRVMELILTPLWAAPVYWILSYVDHVSERDPLPERGNPNS